MCYNQPLRKKEKTQKNYKEKAGDPNGSNEMKETQKLKNERKNTMIMKENVYKNMFLGFSESQKKACFFMA